jgi:hypothetical protein
MRYIKVMKKSWHSRIKSRACSLVVLPLSVLSSLHAEEKAVFNAFKIDVNAHLFHDDLYKSGFSYVIPVNGDVTGVMIMEALLWKKDHPKCTLQEAAFSTKKILHKHAGEYNKGVVNSVQLVKDKKELVKFTDQVPYAVLLENFFKTGSPEAQKVIKNELGIVTHSSFNDIVFSLSKKIDKRVGELIHEEGVNPLESKKVTDPHLKVLLSLFNRCFIPDFKIDSIFKSNDLDLQLNQEYKKINDLLDKSKKATLSDRSQNFNRFLSNNEFQEICGDETAQIQDDLKKSNLVKRLIKESHAVTFEDHVASLIDFDYLLRLKASNAPPESLLYLTYCCAKEHLTMELVGAAKIEKILTAVDRLDKSVTFLQAAPKTDPDLVLGESREGEYTDNDKVFKAGRNNGICRHLNPTGGVLLTVMGFDVDFAINSSGSHVYLTVEEKVNEKGEEYFSKNIVDFVVDVNQNPLIGGTKTWGAHQIDGNALYHTNYSVSIPKEPNFTIPIAEKALARKVK